MSRLHYYRFDYQPALGERLPECAAKDGEVGVLVQKWVKGEGGMLRFDDGTIGVFVTRWPRGEGGVLRFDDGTFVAAFAEELTYEGAEEVPL